MSDEATRLATHRRVTVVGNTSDAFFSALASTYEVVRTTGRRQSVGVVAAVADAKRQLSTQQTPVDLHDLVQEETERIEESPHMTTTDQEKNIDQYTDRRDSLFAVSEVLLGCVCAAAF